MAVFPRRAALVCALALVFLSACFVRRRSIPAPGIARNRPLLSATKDDLIDRLQRFAGPIAAFNMRADMSPSIGALYGGELTDYATIRAYILFLRPDDIRVIGLDPVVHTTTIFDMVSTGNSFRVFIPSKNAFYIGNNDAPPSSTNKLENLRPAAFLTALIVEPPAPEDVTLFADDTDETKALYVLMMARREGGQLRLSRAVYFDRYTLEIAQQKTYNPAGDIVSETRYSDWDRHGDISYPSTIVIRRPKDGYEVTVKVLSVRFNPADLTAQQFVLQQPPAARVTEIK